MAYLQCPYSSEYWPLNTQHSSLGPYLQRERRSDEIWPYRLCNSLCFSHMTWGKRNSRKTSCVYFFLWNNLDNLLSLLCLLSTSPDLYHLHVFYCGAFVVVSSKYYTPTKSTRIRSTMKQSKQFEYFDLSFLCVVCLNVKCSIWRDVRYYWAVYQKGFTNIAGEIILISYC